jgi:hypothetical protein
MAGFQQIVRWFGCDVGGNEVLDALGGTLNRIPFSLVMSGRKG